MESRRTGDFEFKLGKFGLILFTFAVSLLLVASFIFGVIVGKNIDSYPQKIAKGIPNTIKKTITSGMADTVPDDTKETEAGITARTEHEKKKDEFNLTFYDTLTDKTKKPAQVKRTVKAKRTTQTKTGDIGRYVYTVQIASFKERDKTEALALRLKKLKLSPVIDTVSLTASGTWFRVKLEEFPSYDAAKQKAQFLEKRIRGIKCLIIKNKR